MNQSVPPPYNPPPSPGPRAATHGVPGASAGSPHGKKVRVIDSLWTFSVAVVCVGPLALPLLWRNPRFKSSTKIIGSLVIVAITVFCIWALKSVTQMATQMGIQLDQIQ